MTVSGSGSGEPSVKSQRGWPAVGLAVVLLLVLASPVFAWAAGSVGYAEPLENAAERTGAVDAAADGYAGVLPDYTVPVGWLGDGAGVLVSGLVGTALTLVVMVGVGRILQDSGQEQE